jgi:hypothetical protein
MVAATTCEPRIAMSHEQCGRHDGAGLHIDRLTGRGSLLRSTSMEGINAASIKPETSATVRAHQSDCAHRGESAERATEIAAPTVDKERASSGESRTASKTLTNDISAARRGTLRPHSRPGGRTKERLYAEARKRGIKARPAMTKAQLERALAH